MKYALIKNGELDTNVIYSQYAPAAHDAQNYTIGTGFDCWVVILYTKFERECTAKATKYFDDEPEILSTLDADMDL